jgi:hypothetical protein
MTDIIAAHVAEYEYDGERGYYECLCAKRWLVERPMGSSDYYRDHAEHVAAELAAAGYGNLADAWGEGHESGFWNGRHSSGHTEMPLVGLEHAEANNPYRGTGHE